MKVISKVVVVIACTFAASAANAALSDADAAKLMAQYGCQGCHSVDQKVVGPAFKDVAKKYAGDPGAAGRLENKVRTGGSGVWGAVPMIPNNVPQSDLAPLIQWILALK